MMTKQTLSLFEEHRQLLFGIAYRMLGTLDHLRHPVPTDVKRIEPLEERNARMMFDFRDGAFDGFELAADFFEQVLGFFEPPGFFADP